MSRSLQEIIERTSTSTKRVKLIKPINQVLVNDSQLESYQEDLEMRRDRINNLKTRGWA
ncbi:MAG: hypothetical protein SAK29_01290 [Scytonema sp. PMC 1069.18]|nr:hypothetical protein [Scytonema sp. PMC 1069.18]MEC4811909.1 hypothetical protein [Scytonema sp. PMC 1069.18]MEC4884988.1 hypothetical protein [Scytonema sp. PMC 1070.18]